MRLILVRHGETIENREGIMQGQQHGRLTDLGKEQARLVGERLKDEKIDVLISSDLKRAIDTAEEIAKHHPGLKVELEPRFREWSRGHYEGKKFDEVPKELTGVDLHKNVDFSFPGGESIRDVFIRVEKAFREVLERHKKDNVLIMGHGIVLRVMMRAVKGLGVEDEFHLKEMPNTSVTIYEIKEDGKHEEVCFNCGKHLHGLD